jgi:hypothetical protein
VRTSDVQTCLESYFLARGWQRERVAKLPQSFVRQTLVTPFFQPRILRRSETCYLIDGYLGVLHREFECQWVASQLSPLIVNSYCLALNIANIDALRSTQRVAQNTLPSDSLKFGSVVLTLLDKLPSDETALSTAFDRRVLMDLPLEKFVIHGRTEKLLQLERFISFRRICKS